MPYQAEPLCYTLGCLQNCSATGIHKMCLRHGVWWLDLKPKRGNGWLSNPYTWTRQYVPHSYPQRPLSFLNSHEGKFSDHPGSYVLILYRSRKFREQARRIMSLHMKVSCCCWKDAVSGQSTILSLWDKKLIMRCNSFTQLILQMAYTIFSSWPEWDN